jgi:hypothetical protein
MSKAASFTSRMSAHGPQRAFRPRPEVVRDIFRQFQDSKRAADLAEGGALDPYGFGVEACRPNLEIIIDFCWQQN